MVRMNCFRMRVMIARWRSKLTKLRVWDRCVSPCACRESRSSVRPANARQWTRLTIVKLSPHNRIGILLTGIAKAIVSNDNRKGIWGNTYAADGAQWWGCCCTKLPALTWEVKEFIRPPW